MVLFLLLFLIAGGTWLAAVVALARTADEDETLRRCSWSLARLLLGLRRTVAIGAWFVLSSPVPRRPAAIGQAFDGLLGSRHGGPPFLRVPVGTAGWVPTPRVAGAAQASS